ncbi:hypothetical protein [Streptomyces sp. NPDC001652]|uniref:hypothetical protein n=1 Tax=Streptomyces sp. NPDC001652 TaxID=3154393 RepID=UPI0033200E19
MDLHAWITQQVDRDERLIDEKGPPNQVKRLLLRIEADRRILVRHRIDPSRVEDWMYATACEGCGDWGEFGYPNSENLNDCPELLDLGHAHGLTDEILAGLDRPEPPERKPRKADRRWGMPVLTGPQLLGMQAYTPMRDVPEALRGPHWKP